MKYERAKYEFPIDDIARREKADAPAGVYLLGGRWHLAAHDSLAEACLIDAGALLVATLTFTAPATPAHLAPLTVAAVLQMYATHAS
jgi:hypothetical protein